MRRSVPLLKTVVPGLSQISPTPNLASSKQDAPFSNFRNTEERKNSTSIDQAYPNEFNNEFIITDNTTTSTSTTTTTTFTDYDDGTSQIDNSLATATRINDVGGIRDQLDNVFDELQVGPSAHPGEIALVESMKAVASNDIILEQILKLPQFQTLVNSIPPFSPAQTRTLQNQESFSEEEGEELLQRAQPARRRSVVSSGTQTEESYIESVERRIQSLSLQLSAPVSSSFATTTASSASAPPSFPPPSSNQSGMPVSENAGIPGNVDNSPVVLSALKYVLPLALLAVAAAVLRTKGALVLFKTGVKVICGKVFGYVVA